MVKLNELSLELLPHPPYSPDLVPSDYWLFTDLKKKLQGKRFGSNEEVVAETEAYFESNDESFSKKSLNSFKSVVMNVLLLKKTMLRLRKNAIESIAFLSKIMYITDSNQYAIELVTYLLVLVVYFYEFIVYVLLERNAFESIAFFLSG